MSSCQLKAFLSTKYGTLKEIKKMQVAPVTGIKLSWFFLYHLIILYELPKYIHYKWMKVLYSMILILILILIYILFFIYYTFLLMLLVLYYLVLTISILDFMSTVITVWALGNHLQLGWVSNAKFLGISLISICIHTKSIYTN